VAEANLRSHSHPKFIRWATSNGNRPRILFLRLVGILLVLLGLILDTLLILSRQSHFLRITCLVLLWPGLTILIAAYKRLCVVLHFYSERQLRPWELFGDSPEEKGMADDDDAFPFPEKDKSSSSGGGFRKHSRVSTSISSIGSHGADPLRKSSLQPFGPKNNTGGDKWASQYDSQGMLQRIMGETAPVQNTALKLLQDRTMFLAVLWGGLLASALTAASLFVPAGNFFM